MTLTEIQNRIKEIDELMYNDDSACHNAELMSELRMLCAQADEKEQNIAELSDAEFYALSADLNNVLRIAEEDNNDHLKNSLESTRLAYAQERVRRFKANSTR